MDVRALDLIFTRVLISVDFFVHTEELLILFKDLLVSFVVTTIWVVIF